MENTYNYLESIKNDIREFLEDDWAFNIDELRDNRESFEEELNDRLWVCDAVTGNASGSYTFCRFTAEENLCHNLELLCEACEEFGIDLGSTVKEGAETCDVTIRCYLLSQAISEVLDEVESISEGEETA